MELYRNAMKRALVLLAACIVASGQQGVLKLPLKDKSVRFAVIGDTGTGQKAQMETAAEMAKMHELFPFEFVLMMGDNVYGGQAAADFQRKFELPYHALLDVGVKFYACLGNHDDSNDRVYKPFHMEGKRFYSFKQGNAEFFALDSTYMDPDQLDWLKKQLADSTAAWKICYFHHPLYSAGRMHGPDLDLRKLLEPIFRSTNVSVVLNGHDHVYERIKPQDGIFYFIVGSSGELRVHDLRPSDETARGFDADRAFGLMEIVGDQLYFQAVSRTGETVDSGILEARKVSEKPKDATTHQ
jgi:predicted phosphodiesterase